MGDIMLKVEEEIFYTSESRSTNKSSTKSGYKNGDKGRSHQRTTQPRRTQKNDNNSFQGKRFEGIRYNCGKKGQCSYYSRQS